MGRRFFGQGYTEAMTPGHIATFNVTGAREQQRECRWTADEVSTALEGQPLLYQQDGIKWKVRSLLCPCPDLT